MPDLNPTIAGRIFNLSTSFGDAAGLWSSKMPHTDSTGGNGGTADGHQDLTIQVITTYYAETIGGFDVRVLMMSFDTSGISAAPESATLKIFGKTNQQTGNPASHATNGILGLKVLGMAATDSLAQADWGAMDLDGAGPTLYTDTLATWNIVGDSTEHNILTLNATALADMTNNDTIQIAIAHKFVYDHYDSNPPFAFGNNSPDGDDEFTAGAGAYFGSVSGQAAYKPVLSYNVASVPILNTIKLNSGNLTLNSGTLLIKWYLY